MKFKSEIWMKGIVDKKAKKEGLEVDEKEFEGMKPGDTKIVKRDCIYGIEENGTRYVKLITGWHRFREEKQGG